MSAHTPGPWTARQEYANVWRIEVPREGYVPVSVATVVTTILEVGGNDKDTAANARLIAAAPYLLDALELIAKDSRNGLGSTGAAGWYETIARTAIAKATGSST